MPCKFSQQSCDQVRFEPLCDSPLDGKRRRQHPDGLGDVATPAQSQRTWKTSLPLKWRDSLTRWASAASDNR